MLGNHPTRLVEQQPRPCRPPLHKGIQHILWAQTHQQLAAVDVGDGVKWLVADW